MNSCILMAEIVQAPQLRYTPGENQIAVAEMLVQFPGLRAEDPPATLKVVGWGNLAQEIQERCHQGDRVLIEGRLNMNTIDRSEGFKEKRAELTAQRLHYLGLMTDSPYPAPSPVAEPAFSSQPSARPTSYSTSAPTVATPAVASSRQATEPMPQPRKQERPSAPMPANDADVDDIPF